MRNFTLVILSFSLLNKSQAMVSYFKHAVISADSVFDTTFNRRRQQRLEPQYYLSVDHSKRDKQAEVCTSAITVEKNAATRYDHHNWLAMGDAVSSLNIVAINPLTKDD